MTKNPTLKFLESEQGQQVILTFDNNSLLKQSSLSLVVSKLSKHSSRMHYQLVH